MNNLNQRITEVTMGLSRLSQEGFDIVEITKIWAKIPDGNPENEDYLDLANQCILEVSSLVDSRFPNLSTGLKTAKKLRLLASLLDLKANQIESL